MAPSNEGQRIVRTWTDSSCGTGDYFVKTEDGTAWKVHALPRVGEPRTGQRLGKLSGGKVEER